MNAQALKIWKYLIWKVNVTNPDRSELRKNVQILMKAFNIVVFWRRFLERDDEIPVDVDLKQHQRPAIWYAEKDNAFPKNPPCFVSPREIKIVDATPYSNFIQIFTEDVFKHIILETIQYPIYGGKD